MAFEQGAADATEAVGGVDVVEADLVAIPHAAHRRDDAVTLGDEKLRIRVFEHAADAFGPLVGGPGSNGDGIVPVVGAAELGDRSDQHLAHRTDIGRHSWADSDHLTTASSRMRMTVLSSWPRFSTRPSWLSTIYCPCLLRSLGFFSIT